MLKVLITVDFVQCYASSSEPLGSRKKTGGGEGGENMIEPPHEKPTAREKHNLSLVLTEMSGELTWWSRG
jgi:hypothetical protein